MAKQPKNSLDAINVEFACGENWDEMRGNDTMRFCSHCAKNVHDLSAMTRKQAKKFVAESARSGNEICVRYARLPNGRIATAAPPIASPKLHQIAGRAARLAAGVVGASIALTTAANAQDSCKLPKPQQESRKLSHTQGAIVTMGKPAPPRGGNSKDKTLQCDAVKQRYKIALTIRDPNGAVVPNAEIKLINQDTKEELILVTNDKGIARSFAVRGKYEVKIEGVPGFKPLSQRFIEVREQNNEFNTTLEPTGEMVGELIVDEFYELPLSQAIISGDVEAARQMILQGADVQAKDQNNATALHAAVEAGNVEIARLLLDKGANVNAKTTMKQTPLLMIDEDATPELVRLLIERGANVNAPDDANETALAKAVLIRKTEIVKILLEAGANVLPEYAEKVRKLLDSGSANK